MTQRTGEGGQRRPPCPATGSAWVAGQQPSAAPAAAAMAGADLGRHQLQQGPLGRRRLIMHGRNLTTGIPRSPVFRPLSLCCRAVARICCQEFVEAQRVITTTPVSFSDKAPPMELAGEWWSATARDALPHSAVLFLAACRSSFYHCLSAAPAPAAAGAAGAGAGRKDLPRPSEGFVGYLSFSLFARQVDTEDKRRQAVDLLTNFRCVRACVRACVCACARGCAVSSGRPGARCTPRTTPRAVPRHSLSPPDELPLAAPARSPSRHWQRHWLQVVPGLPHQGDEELPPRAHAQPRDGLDAGPEPVGVGGPLRDAGEEADVREDLHWWGRCQCRRRGGRGGGFVAGGGGRRGHSRGQCCERAGVFHDGRARMSLPAQA